MSALISTSSSSSENITATTPEAVTMAIFDRNNTTIFTDIYNTTSTDVIPDQEWIKILTTVFSAFIMIFIIVAAIFGNMLVIISVMRVRKLRWALWLYIIRSVILQKWSLTRKYKFCHQFVALILPVSICQYTLTGSSQIISWYLSLWLILWLPWWQWLSILVFKLTKGESAGTNVNFSSP